MATNDPRALILEAFANVVEDRGADETTISKYFSKNYVQHVDGKVLNYNDFVAHMKTQKAVMRSIKITFKEIVVEGGKVATTHYADGVKMDGTKMRAQVNAIFEVRDGKIVSCKEVTHLIEGTKADRDLGSRIDKTLETRD